MKFSSCVWPDLPKCLHSGPYLYCMYANSTGMSREKSCLSKVFKSNWAYNQYICISKWKETRTFFTNTFYCLYSIFIKIMSIINFKYLVTLRNASKTKKQVVSNQY